MDGTFKQADLEDVMSFLQPYLSSCSEHSDPDDNDTQLPGGAECCQPAVGDEEVPDVADGGCPAPVEQECTQPECGPVHTLLPSVESIQSQYIANGKTEGRRRFPVRKEDIDTLLRRSGSLLLASTKLYHMLTDIAAQQCKGTGRTCHRAQPQSRRWTREENLRFNKCVSYFGYTRLTGMNALLVSTFVGTRDRYQVRSHAQKFFKKMNRGGSAGTTSSELAAASQALTESDRAALLALSHKYDHYPVSKTGGV